MSDTFRVRFAPSPTGNLHIGGARTALFNYLFAKRYKSKFILRIEDTDIDRSTELALKSQLSDLAWLGIQWDEGIMPDGSTKGDYGPYKQSLRLDVYQQYINQLINNDQAYYCFLTTQELEQQKQQCISNNQPYRPSSPYRDYDKSQALERIAKGDAAVIRFKAPKHDVEYVIDDIVRGEVKFSSSQAGDFVIMRTNSMPMYNFCCVVDDALMKITHVFRGEEHLTNTLKQLMLMQALDFTPPKYAHTSVILGVNGKKLSKRDGAVAVDNYRQDGFLHTAVNNYIAQLGWNDGTEQEIYSIEELEAKFATTELNAAAPVFDIKKLQWVNSQHIKQMPNNRLWEAVKLFGNISLPCDLSDSWGVDFVAAFKQNFVTLKDAVDLLNKIFETNLELNNESIEVLQWEASNKVILEWLHILDTEKNDLNETWFLHALTQIKQSADVSGKKLFMPLRVAMLGEAHGAELKILVTIVPKSILQQRALACLNKIMEQ